MRVRTRTTLAALAAVVALATAACAGDGGGDAAAAGDGPTRMRMVYTSGIISYLPLYVADSQGIFAEHGIEYSAIRAEGDADAIRSIAAGQAELITGVPEPFVTAVATGIPMKMISSVMNHNLYEVYSRPEITSVAQLKGTKIGVLTEANATATQMQWLLDQEGVGEANATYVSVGSISARLTSLVQNQVSATILADPQSLQADAAGMHKLISMRDLPGAGSYPQTVVMAGDKVIENEPAALVRFNEALVEADQWIQANPDKAVDVAVEYLKIEKPVAQQAFAKVKDFFDGDIKPNPEGLDWTIGVATKYGGLKQAPAVADLYYEPTS